MNLSWKRYLLWFAQEHVDFRFAEITSIIQLLNIPIKWVEEPTPEDPYWIVQLPSEEAAHLIASRSVSLRCCLELWGRAKDIPTLHESLKKYPFDEMSKYFQSDISFKIHVETFCKHFTQKEKVQKIETFSYLPLKGTVQLIDPDVCLHYIEYYGLNPNDIPEKPLDVFFGRWICDSARYLISKISLKTRKFIGNTSMDAQLSLIMANQACCKPGDICLDPFVGSGSLLVAAAQFGAYVIGTDIDYMMLHARTRPSRITQKKREINEGILLNMKQYHLEHLYLDVLVADFSLPLWRSEFQIDSIITDPPYGIRESTEKIGIEKDNYELTEEHLQNHVPSKVDYGLSQIYHDLLSFSAEHLKLNGRLVCWFPVYRDDYSPEILPENSCLQLIANSEQILNKYTSRRLLTYEKVKEFDKNHLDVMKEIPDFRQKYFAHGDETRKERKAKRAELREIGRLESLKRSNNQSDNR
ncbi:tRNA (guanine(10)-N2)-methyltransferase homolog [Chrysoperla carnea]|uniref:tRNA (guanine(10)-N2)-methyltransferase homolog n=1 Tax=Chrysoperla carnea TaxID=189513 RepID=UPI001D05E4B7|nr:tRNA (guanine(10)-N2)-methyltransferase homolog [Chrysoperla carnea]